MEEYFLIFSRMLLTYSNNKMSIKKKLIFLEIITLLILIPLVYANSYGSSTYGNTVYGENESSALYCGDGVCNNGETCSSCSADCGSCGGGPSGGGSSGTATYQCTQDSNCKTNQYCFNHTCYEAECFDNSVCNTNEGETCWNHRCVKLFDMEILNFESPVKVGEFFNFTYFVKAVAEINGDVQIDFWIENKDQNKIASGRDTIYMSGFEEKTKAKKLFLPSDLSSGSYMFYIQVTYGTYTAEAHRNIEINIDENGLATISLIPEFNYLTVYIISVLIGLGVFIVCLIFYLERRKIKKGLIKEKKWIKKHKISILVLILIIIMGILIYYFRWYEQIELWFERIIKFNLNT